MVPKSGRAYVRDCVCAPRGDRLSIVGAGMTRAWSTYQQAIFADIESGQGNTVVLARAGSGKTSTLEEASKRLPGGARATFVAFNKAIATELSARLPSSVECSTLHSAGFKALRRAWPRTQVDDRHVRKIIREDFAHLPRDWDIPKAVSLCKANLNRSTKFVDACIGEFDLSAPENGYQRREFCESTIEVLDSALEDSRHTGVIDFDDMIYLPIVEKLRLPQYSHVFVDETQDLNASQLEMVIRMRAPKGRIVAVGDDRQAIYRFRGADSNAVKRIVDATDAKILPLSICYRCGRKVIEQAKRFVPDIEAAPGAPEGIVSEISEEKLPEKLLPGDFVLSRTNAPLLSLCFRLIADGKSAHVRGRDIGQGLETLLRKSKTTTIRDLLAWVEKWSQKEIARRIENDQDIDVISDKRDCMVAIAAMADTIDELHGVISALFSDETGGITLSSTHKAKGLEADRVYMLASTYGKWPGIEEDNLQYVAITRARKELYFAAGAS
jgi:DNA helicase II / ATP-dependent DNA helicase PcrA